MAAFPSKPYSKALGMAKENPLGAVAFVADRFWGDVTRLARGVREHLGWESTPAGEADRARSVTYRSGALDFAVECEDPTALQRLQCLFAGFEVVERPARLVYRVTGRQGSPHQYGLTVGGETVVHDHALDAVVDEIITRLDRDVLDASPEHLHVHAAAAIDGVGRTVVLLGPSRAGKSTLVAQLIRAGMHYLTDEMVAIVPGDAGVRLAGLAKPLGIRRDQAEALALDGHPAAVHGADAVHVPAQALGDGTGGRDAGPGLVLLLDRSGGAARFEPAHPAELVVELLVQSFDAVRLGAPSLVAAATLAAGSVGGRLCYGEAAEAVDVVTELLHTAAAPSCEVVPIVTPPPGDGGPAPSPTVSGVRVGERVVLVDAATRHILALDEPTSGLWELLDGRQSIEALAAELAAESGTEAGAVAERLEAQVRGLAAAGFLAEAAP
jgi:hypothetical protein